ncbi:MAG: hypothetical protein NW207_04750 [Cytophagales bacterium]|nr:hypothetical protein [Cytophagales bacterium]
MNKHYQPCEIIQKFPACPFTEAQIGVLFSAGLLRGVRKHRYTLIEFDSVIALVKFRNENIERSKTKIDVS